MKTTRMLYLTLKEWASSGEHSLFSADSSIELIAKSRPRLRIRSQYKAPILWQWCLRIIMLSIEWRSKSTWCTFTKWKGRDTTWMALECNKHSTNCRVEFRKELRKKSEIVEWVSLALAVWLKLLWTQFIQVKLWVRLIMAWHSLIRIWCQNLVVNVLVTAIQTASRTGMNHF